MPDELKAEKRRGGRELSACAERRGEEKHGRPVAPAKGAKAKAPISKREIAGRETRVAEPKAAPGPAAERAPMKKGIHAKAFKVRPDPRGDGADSPQRLPGQGIGMEFKV
ncbi:hypothetical protein [Acidovorax sp. NCPPB 3576]|uniref:hypothetical protein n=1 Tax=Acidovorax sp. NCPPB 3576 TaxID=2940488 RepID=UPI00234BF987|nr:hypothetical protein [Acidovorax sp. NCPPB 3576]WCM89085.1 hypothetical protein M5C98_03290 [Acidovorax sp. NCPPB 3576]